MIRSRSSQLSLLPLKPRVRGESRSSRPATADFKVGRAIRNLPPSSSSPARRGSSRSSCTPPRHRWCLLLEKSPSRHSEHVTFRSDCSGGGDGGGGDKCGERKAANLFPSSVWCVVLRTSALNTRATGHFPLSLEFRSRLYLCFERTLG
jgi:hypothetical protein